MNEFGHYLESVPAGARGNDDLAPSEPAEAQCAGRLALVRASRLLLALLLGAAGCASDKGLGGYGAGMEGADAGAGGDAAIAGDGAVGGAQGEGADAAGGDDLGLDPGERGPGADAAGEGGAGPVDEPVERTPVDEPVERAPVDEPVERAPVDEPVDEPVERAPVDEPVDEPVERAPADEPIVEPDDKAAPEDPQQDPPGGPEPPVTEPELTFCGDGACDPTETCDGCAEDCPCDGYCAPGGACEPLLKKYATCEDDAQCQSGVCDACDAQSGKRFCLVPQSLGLGDVCRLDAECAVGACNNDGIFEPFGGVCASNQGVCQCVTDADCASNEYCNGIVNTDETACFTKQPPGGPCAEDRWCLSDTCLLATNTCL